MGKDKVLIVDDEPQIRNILSRILEDEGYEAQTASGGREAIEISKDFHPDIILMDLSMPDMDGIEAMSAIREFDPEVRTIIITAYGTIRSAVEAMKRGAYDYITKPFDNDELLLTVDKALEVKHLSQKVGYLEKQLEKRYSFDNIVGVSGKMGGVFDLMNKVCRADTTVLIQGESGTGKELIVRAIHHHSQRKDGPFVALNCGAIPSNLMESEFFGHERGAFTDAKERKIGKFELSSGGTLFLDEVSELPQEAQVKLLRAIQEREITRIGGDVSIPVDVRIIATTNKNLEELVKKGSFREDLYYRLNVVSIRVPPLRERPEDIPPLVDHFLNKYRGELGLEVRRVSKEALSLLRRYDWPGNVRELENAVCGAMVMAESDTIQSSHLPLRIQGLTHTEEKLEDLTLAEIVARVCRKVERESIQKALQQCDGNRTRAAAKLGISRKTLFNKMREYGLG